jgi:hypothetical protein
MNSQVDTLPSLAELEDVDFERAFESASPALRRAAERISASDRPIAGFGSFIDPE